MRLKSSTISLCRKILYESLTTDAMVRFVRLVEPEYDLHERSGIPVNIPITNQMAAERIVTDILADDRFIDFVEVLVKIDAEGHMGRSYPIMGLGQIVKILAQDGFVLDRSTGQFFENTNERASPDWGRLHEGDERQTSILRLDVVDNSALVQRNRPECVDAAFAALRAIVTRAVVGRFGRVWSWEGDGAVKDAIQMEASATPADTFSASSNLFLSIDRTIQDRFGPDRQSPVGDIRHYAVNLEKA